MVEIWQRFRSKDVWLDKEWLNVRSVAWLSYYFIAVWDFLFEVWPVAKLRKLFALYCCGVSATQRWTRMEGHFCWSPYLYAETRFAYEESFYLNRDWFRPIVIP